MLVTAHQDTKCYKAFSELFSETVNTKVAMDESHDIRDTGDNGMVYEEQEQPTTRLAKPNNAFLARMLHGVQRGNQRVIDTTASKAARKVRRLIWWPLMLVSQYEQTL